MWEWLPATTIAAGCRSHQKAKHIGVQLPWKQVMARGAIRNPPTPFSKGGEMPASSYSPFNKGLGGFRTLPVTGYRKTAHQAISQGARRFGKRSISEDM
jgi:hypothetical protein